MGDDRYRDGWGDGIRGSLFSGGAMRFAVALGASTSWFEGGHQLDEAVFQVCGIAVSRIHFGRPMSGV